MSGIIIEITDGFTIYNHNMSEVLADTETGETLLASREGCKYFAIDSQGRSFDVAEIDPINGEVSPKSKYIKIL